MFKRMSTLSLVFMFTISSMVLPLFVVSPAEAQSSGVPNNPTTLLSEAELDEIRTRANRGEQPQKTARDRLLTKANSFLSFKALSVTTNGGGNELRSTQKDTADYNNARKMSEAIYNLSMAYRLSGQDRYAKKALELLDHWTINDRTLMNPNMGQTPSTGRLRVYITVTGMIYGADLIWGYSGWSQSQRSDFSSWTRTLGRTAITTPVDSYTHPDGTKGSKNNKESWRQFAVAMAGGFLGDQDMMDHAFQAFKDGLPSDVGAPGTRYAGILLKERTRTTPKGGLFYSMYGMTAMGLVAEVAWQHGQDLYTYRTKNVSLKYAADTYVKYALNPGSWPYNNTKGVDNTTFSIYEFLYKRTGDPDYLKVINKYKRPLNLDYTIIGNVTVGHARDNNDTSVPNNPNNGTPDTPPPSTDDNNTEDKPMPEPTPVPDNGGEPTEGPVIGINRRSDPCRPLSETVSTTFGTAEFEVDIPQSGRYTVWSRVWAPDNAVNSYWMSIDNGYEETCKIIVGDNGSLIPGRTWTWVDWHRDPSATPKEQPFIVDFANPGTYSFEVAGREGPLRLDKVVFIADDCVPEGFGENCQVRGDLESPIVSMNLTNGSTVSGTIPVNVTVEDENRLESITLSIDGDQVDEQSGESGDYSFSVNTANVQDGRRTITATAEDANGNKSNVSVRVNVNNAQPQDDGPTTGSDDQEPDNGNDQQEPEPTESDNIDSNLSCANANAFICSTFDFNSDIGSTFRAPVPANGWDGTNGAVVLSDPANGASGNANYLISKRWIRGDKVIEVDAKVDDGNTGWQDFSVLFNFKDSDNYYFASFNTQNDDMTHGIFKVEDGEVEEIADFSSTIEVGRAYSVRVEHQDNSTIVVYRDGEVVGRVLDSTHRNGLAGVGSRNNQVVFDNFVVTRESVEYDAEDTEELIGQAPSQVSGLFQARSGKNRIKLRWSASNDSDGQVESYRVYRSVNGGSFAQLGSTSDLVYYDLTIKENTTYSYYITAIDDDTNESPPSDSITIAKGPNFSYEYRETLRNTVVGAVINTVRKES